MNNYVDKLSRENNPKGISVGVIFADLNGLKRVNDDYGHTMGDTLLKNAAKALEEGRFADLAYFQPFYLKDFIPGKQKKLL